MGAAIICYEINNFGVVIIFKVGKITGEGALEFIDCLVVIADGHENRLLVVGQETDDFELGRVCVLELVEKVVVGGVLVFASTVCAEKVYVVFIAGVREAADDNEELVRYLYRLIDKLAKYKLNGFFFEIEDKLNKMLTYGGLCFAQEEVSV